MFGNAEIGDSVAGKGLVLGLLKRRFRLQST